MVKRKYEKHNEEVHRRRNPYAYFYFIPPAFYDILEEANQLDLVKDIYVDTLAIAQVL